jgi:hypothetical protein
LFVYAAPAMPSAGTTFAPDATVSVASTAVVPPAFTLWRRFWPVSLTTRSRSAAGLKSTPNDMPDSGVVSAFTKVSPAVASSTM